MPGMSTILGGIRRSIEKLRSDMNVKIGDLQKQIDGQQAEIDELRARLDSYDKPAASSKSRKAPAKKSASKKRPVPVPEKPDVLKAAEEAAEE